MLILPQLVQVKIASRNSRHYKTLGYNVRNGDIITTDVMKLSKGSHVKVKCKCDVCGCDIERAYKDYLYNHDYKDDMDFCENCKIVKSRKTNLEKYGVDNPMKCEEVKETLKKSLEEKYGTYKISSLPEIREKIKHSCLEKYGVENSLQLQVTRERMKEYFNTHSDEMKKKREDTNIKKYGCKNPFGNKEIKDKIKKTNLAKYGVEYVSQLDEIQEKIKKTNLERYGVESVFQLSSTKLKAKEYFNLHKDEIIEKRMNTLRKNGEIHTSSQQITVCEMLKEQYENVELNYVFNKFSLDIALFVCDKKIDVEYDGWYWHQDKQRDRRRDEVLKSQGWSILRIKSGNKLPSVEQLIEKIDNIIDKDIRYSEIVLDDWKEVV